MFDMEDDDVGSSVGSFVMMNSFDIGVGRIVGCSNTKAKSHLA